MERLLAFELKDWGGEFFPICFYIEPEYGVDGYREIVSKELSELNEMIDQKKIGVEGERFAAQPLNPPKTFEIQTQGFFPVRHTVVDTPKWVERYARKIKPGILKKISKKILPEKTLNDVRRHCRDFLWMFQPPSERIKDKTEIEKKFRNATNFICLAERFWLANKDLVSKYFSENKRTVLNRLEAPLELSGALTIPLKRFNTNSFEGWLRCSDSIDLKKSFFVLYENQLEEAITLIRGMGVEVPDFYVIPENDMDSEKRGHFVSCLETDDTSATLRNDNDKIDQWPKISVVIISYNQVDFIRECLESVLNQDYPSLECIVVDGQSTDGTCNILLEYKERVDRLIMEPDRCQSDGLHKGFRLASGDMLTWLCSDDLMEKGALRNVGRAFMKHRSDIVAGGCRIVDFNGDYLCNHHNGFPLNKPSRLSFGDLVSFTGVWERGMYFYQPDIYFSRRIWEASGGYIKEHLHFAMDYDLFLRFAMAGAGLVHIPDYLARRRIHEKQKTQHETMSYLPTIRSLIREYQIMLDKIPVRSGVKHDDCP
jgi:GT2 family glycosyltransferase